MVSSFLVYDQLFVSAGTQHSGALCPEGSEVTSIYFGFSSCHMHCVRLNLELVKYFTIHINAVQMAIKNNKAFDFVFFVIGASFLCDS